MGEWLREALVDLSRRVKSGVELDEDVISSLVSSCDHASPSDAKEYLDDIIGSETGREVIEEYLRLRGDPGRNKGVHPDSTLHTYVKPRPAPPRPGGDKFRERESKAEGEGRRGKKKAGKKQVSVADVAKGSIVFEKGEVCWCQARRHGLVGNCLSCGRVACEQEGEGPCVFCGTLVLRDGAVDPGPDRRVAGEAEVLRRRLVGYDRESAARTAVIDDQSDYYEMEGNRWISAQEKEALRKTEEARREADRARRRRVVVTFDMFGRKVIVGEGGGEAEEAEKGVRSEGEEVKGSSNRIRCNPSIHIPLIFENPKYSRSTNNEVRWGPDTGLCVHITGRVQHEYEGAPPLPPHT